MSFIKKMIALVKNPFLFITRNRATVTVIFTILITFIVFLVGSLNNRIDESYKKTLARATELVMLNSVVSAHTSNQTFQLIEMLRKNCFNSNNYQDDCEGLATKIKLLNDEINTNVKSGEWLEDEFRISADQSNKIKVNNERKIEYLNWFYSVLALFLIIINVISLKEKNN